MIRHARRNSYQRLEPWQLFEQLRVLAFQPPPPTSFVPLMWVALLTVVFVYPVWQALQSLPEWFRFVCFPELGGEPWQLVQERAAVEVHDTVALAPPVN